MLAEDSPTPSNIFKILQNLFAKIAKKQLELQQHYKEHVSSRFGSTLHSPTCSAGLNQTPDMSHLVTYGVHQSLLESASVMMMQTEFFYIWKTTIFTFLSLLAPSTVYL